MLSGIYNMMFGACIGSPRREVSAPVRGGRNRASLCLAVAAVGLASSASGAALPTSSPTRAGRPAGSSECDLSHITPLAYDDPRQPHIALLAERFGISDTLVQATLVEEEAASDTSNKKACLDLLASKVESTHFDKSDIEVTCNVDRTFKPQICPPAFVLGRTGETVRILFDESNLVGDAEFFDVTEYRRPHSNWLSLDRIYNPRVLARYEIGSQTVGNTIGKQEIFSLPFRPDGATYALDFFEPNTTLMSIRPGANGFMTYLPQKDILVFYNPGTNMIPNTPGQTWLYNATVPLSSYPEGMARFGGRMHAANQLPYLYLGNSNGFYPLNITTLDISDPSNPEMTSFIQTGIMSICGNRCFDIGEGRMVIASVGNTSYPTLNLTTYDLTDPAHPSFLGSKAFDLDIDLVGDVLVKENRTYVVGGGIAAFDHSDLENPKLMRFQPENYGSSSGLLIYGMQFFKADGMIDFLGFPEKNTTFYPSPTGTPYYSGHRTGFGNMLFTPAAAPYYGNTSSNLTALFQWNVSGIPSKSDMGLHFLNATATSRTAGSISALFPALILP